MSKSSSRRARARRVAVRHSLRASLQLNHDLYYKAGATVLRPDTDEFVPQPGSVEVDSNSMYFQLKGESIVTRPLQSRILSEGSVSCTRKELREIVTLDILPLVDATVQCEVYGIEFDVTLKESVTKPLCC